MRERLASTLWKVRLRISGIGASGALRRVSRRYYEARLNFYRSGDTSFCTYLMKVLPTPLGGMLTSMTVEYGEESLAADRVKINYKGVSIFHGSSASFVFGYADRKGGVVCRYTIENLNMR